MKACVSLSVASKLIYRRICEILRRWKYEEWKIKLIWSLKTSYRFCIFDCDAANLKVPTICAQESNTHRHTHCILTDGRADTLHHRFTPFNSVELVCKNIKIIEIRKISSIKFVVDNLEFLTYWPVLIRSLSEVRMSSIRWQRAATTQRENTRWKLVYI